MLPQSSTSNKYFAREAAKKEKAEKSGSQRGAGRHSF
jgi:hypothetical protein